ncbi:MAG: hypothetical protein VX085_02905 [Pseudomonadota bacterium]|nr:hypothetical protein [Pseudomonadota bacterium]
MRVVRVNVGCRLQGHREQAINCEDGEQSLFPVGSTIAQSRFSYKGFSPFFLFVQKLTVIHPNHDLSPFFASAVFAVFAGTQNTLLVLL